MKLKLLGLVLLALIVGVGVFVWASKEADAPTKSEPVSRPVTTPPKAAKLTDRLIIGEPDAPVTIVEYGDFQCPICKRFFDTTEPTLREEYIDTGKAKIEFRVETHIGEESVLAGQAAYCANDQGKFTDYHDELYKRQSGTNAGTFSAANLANIAAELKLDTKKFNDCLESQKYLAKVEQSHKAAGEAGVTATPTFFIGEQKIVGAQPIGIFRTILDQ